METYRILCMFKHENFALKVFRNGLNTLILWVDVTQSLLSANLTS